jgi:hypothetical protein
MYQATRGGQWRPPLCRCKAAAVARLRSGATYTQGRGTARVGLFFPSQVSPLLMHRWAGLDGFLFLILLASHNNTKQLGFLLFLSSKVRWANEFFIATKKRSNELTKFVVAIEAN